MKPKKKWGARQIGTWTMVVILALVMVGLFYVEMLRQHIVTKQLKKEAEITQTDDSSVKEEDVDTSADDTAKKKEAEKRKESEKKAEPEQKSISLSFRGDSFNTDGADKSSGYPAKVQALLEGENVKAEITDQTWDMAGTLSQMRLAGIPEETVNNYIANHQAAAVAAGLNPALTEIQVRSDLGDYFVDRTDAGMIPVICMGFNGGFNGDMNELIEQQQLILSTYSNQDRYMILGCYPNGWIDGATYDQAMADHWGEHYLSLNSSLSAVDLSDTQRQQIAEAVVQKLKELKYI